MTQMRKQWIYHIETASTEVVPAVEWMGNQEWRQFQNAEK